MAGKSGLRGVSYEFSRDCLYVHHIRHFLHSVQCQLGYRSEFEMLFKGCSSYHQSDQRG